MTKLQFTIAVLFAMVMLISKKLVRSDGIASIRVGKVTMFGGILPDKSPARIGGHIGNSPISTTEHPCTM